MWRTVPTRIQHVSQIHTSFNQTDGKPGLKSHCMHPLKFFTSISNSDDHDKVLTYGSGPRQCVGKILVQKLLRVCTYSDK